jgi:hypothetical protein
VSLSLKKGLLDLKERVVEVAVPGDSGREQVSLSLLSKGVFG